MHIFSKNLKRALKSRNIVSKMRCTWYLSPIKSVIYVTIKL